MSARALSRWQASGLHLLICVAIAAAVVTVMLALWYPRPLFEAAGGNDLLFILVGVDVVLGPLLTLVVFKAGKRGMKFDLTIIGLVQIAALVYGCHIVFLARPAFIVFVKDRFELATAAELDPAELAAAKYPQFRALPLTGPLLVAADMPVDPGERQKVIAAALAGLDLQHFPRYYVPYAERRQEVLSKALPVARMRALEPGIGKVIDAYLVRSKTRESEVRSLLLRTRHAWVAVLVDRRSAEPVKMLLGQKIQ